MEFKEEQIEQGARAMHEAWRPASGMNAWEETPEAIREAEREQLRIGVRAMEERVMVWLITNFTALLSRSAVVYANGGREQAKQVLTRHLHAVKMSTYRNPDTWTITPLTPAPFAEKAQVYDATRDVFY